MKRVLLLLMAVLFILNGCTDKDSPEPTDPDIGVDAKPVIYLYPEDILEINVTLEYGGTLTYTYPTYNDGWTVLADPNGKILHNGDEYSYLFWEGASDVSYDMSSGFVVAGDDTEQFLREKLEYMGLLPHEYNEFIVYWVPLMINNEYNLISFQDSVYTENAKLEITPQPDSILRIFMAYKPLDSFFEIEQQQLATFERDGFTVVEWGGTIVVD